MPQNKPAYILEITWLVVAITAFGISVHSVTTKGIKDSIIPLCITVFATIIYLLRRNLRKK